MAATTYVVQKGDTLSAIAKKLGVSMNSITGYKSGNPNVIYVGEKLTVNTPTASTTTPKTTTTTQPKTQASSFGQIMGTSTTAAPKPALNVTPTPTAAQSAQLKTSTQAKQTTTPWYLQAPWTTISNLISGITTPTATKSTTGMASGFSGGAGAGGGGGGGGVDLGTTASSAGKQLADAAGGAGLGGGTTGNQPYGIQSLEGGYTKYSDGTVRDGSGNIKFNNINDYNSWLKGKSEQDKKNAEAANALATLQNQITQLVEQQKGGGTGTKVTPFSFDWEAADKAALEKLRPYYEDLLNTAQGDVDLAKRRLEEDYARGVRTRTEDLTADTAELQRKQAEEFASTIGQLNKRGVLFGEITPETQGTAAPFSGMAERYFMTPLSERQAARKLALERSVAREQELADVSKTRGLEDVAKEFEKYRKALEKEKVEKATLQMSPLAYQQALDEYNLATKPMAEQGVT